MPTESPPILALAASRSLRILATVAIVHGLAFWVATVAGAADEHAPRAAFQRAGYRVPSPTPTAAAPVDAGLAAALSSPSPSTAAPRATSRSAEAASPAPSASPSPPPTHPPEPTPPPRPPAARAWAAYLAAAASGQGAVVPGPGRQGVSAFVLGHLGPTLALLLAAFLIALPAGVALGVAAVDRRTGRASSALAALAAAGFAMPAFYLGIVGIRGSRALATWTGSDAWLLPASGYGLDRHLLLPALALAVRPLAEIAELTAERLGVEVGAEYVRMARAKGAAGRRVLRHALSNAAPVLVAACAATLRHVVSSAIVVELLFNWPGVGLALARAIAPRIDGRPPSLTLFHPPTVAALVATWTLLYLLAALAAELAERRLDPRRAPTSR